MQIIELKPKNLHKYTAFKKSLRIITAECQSIVSLMIENEPDYTPPSVMECLVRYKI